MHATDLDLNGKDIGELTSPDAFCAFLAKLGYRTTARTHLSPESIGLAGDSARAFKNIELLSEDDEGYFRVVFAKLRSLTARARNDLVRVLGKTTIDHLLILASDYETLELVLLDKRTGGERVQVVPKIINVIRRTPSRLDLRTLRRLTWTRQDGLDQFDKLRSVFDAAACTGDYFQNRGLFADYFLRERLRGDPAWKDNPADIFASVRDLCKDAQGKWQGQEKKIARGQLFERLGFRVQVNRPSRTDQTQPDYLLKDAEGRALTAAFVYPWDRWLDGPDLNDPDTPEENPGACVVTALDQGLADWIVVTNGRLWRLYGKQAHARATNFYEVDLPEALTASADTDPNEAFRYFWLFFRPEAFERRDGGGQRCWLDDVLTGCREHARRLGDRLKDRIFCTIFPHLAQGFLTDRRSRLAIETEPSEEELADIFEATLTLLYRLLFLLYAESRDLLPIREAPYQAASLKRLKEEVAQKAGVAEADVPARLEKAYSAKETALYDRLTDLCRAMDRGDPVLNVPTYSGGLFITDPPPLPGGGEGEGADRREQRIARFLLQHKVPDRFLALALDRLARDQDEKTFALVFIDYKSLEVRHLGSIYEGLLEFKLKVAEEDLTTRADKNSEKYVALSQAKVKRGRQAEVVVRKKEVYLSNDKAERKASGSYYTPDPIVEHIVANTVGAVLDQKLEALRPEFRKVRRTYDQALQKSKAYPSAQVRKGEMDHRQWAAQQTYLAHKDLVEQFFDLKVLDPAMGSGHFLVEAVDFITDRLLKFLNQFPKNPVNIALDRTRASILESLSEQGVTVDPAALTDIHLLKRHVLKRCIYGVDLNPMAVELAKVSLWLDAFTLGAPLNFLDHHLRCGNSLLGAAFSDLESATRTLFPIQYEPLLRAINHVLFISKMADATAAEVSKSATEFASARQFLSGYQVIFDCLLAQHFGMPEAVGHIISAGQELDLSSREKFLASLDSRERQLIARVEALAHRPDRRFFHWDIEFPEVFFGFVDLDQRHLKHKNKIKEGSAGFDVVIGNPPYGSLPEDIRPFVSANYQTGGGKPDIYAYFIEHSLNLVKRGGLSAFITPNTWLTLKAFSRLRKHLLETASIRSLLDTFRIFEDAWVNTAVVVSCRETNADRETHVYIPAKGKRAPEQLQAISSGQWQIAYDIPQTVWANNENSVINYNTDNNSRAIIAKLSARFTRLGDQFDVTTGYQVYHNTRHAAQAIRDRVFHTKAPQRRANYQRCFGGTDVRRYFWSYSSDEYVLCGDNLYRSPHSDFFTRRKILVQEIVGRGYYKISSAYAEEPVYYDKSCLGIILREHDPAAESQYLKALLAVLNSVYATWYFVVAGNKSYGTGDFARLTKADLSELPIPKFAVLRRSFESPDQFYSILDAGEYDKALELVKPQLITPPFPASVMTCMVRLVERIMKVEAGRGDIARTDRSALDPKAQPYQDLLDRMLYRMAGLSDEEAAGLESRLATML